jgi:hypothetical protein
MINVDAGNRPERPENPRELRSAWRLTWLAILGLVVFVLLFVVVSRSRDGSERPDIGLEQQETLPGPGERQRPAEPPRDPQS